MFSALASVGVTVATTAESATAVVIIVRATTAKIIALSEMKTSGSDVPPVVIIRAEIVSTGDRASF